MVRMAKTAGKFLKSLDEQTLDFKTLGKTEITEAEIETKKNGKKKVFVLTTITAFETKTAAQNYIKFSKLLGEI